MIHSSFPSIPLPATEVKRVIAQEVSVCHWLSQASLVTLATGHNALHSLLPWSVLSPAAAETPSIHTDIAEASNSRADTLQSFIFQKKTGHCAGLEELPKGPTGQQEKSPPQPHTRSLPAAGPGCSWASLSSKPYF